MTNRERELEAELQGLRARMEQVQAALREAAVGLWEWDAHMNRLHWSEELGKLTGLSPEQYPRTREDYEHWVYPEDREQVQTAIAEAIEQARFYALEHRFQHPDGTIRWLEVRGLATCDAVGQVIRMYGVALDITARKRAELAQREAEQRFAAFMDHIPAAALIKDRNGRYVYVNRHIREIFQTEWLGRTDRELFSEEVARQFQADDRTVLAENRPREILDVTPSPVGKLHHWRGVKFPFTDAGGQHFLGIVAIDITQHRRLEARQAEFQALGQELNTATTPEEAARIILDCADRLLGWDACWLELHDPETEIVRKLAVMDIVDGKRTDLLPQYQQPRKATGLTRYVRKHGPLLHLFTPETLPVPMTEEHGPFGDVTRPSASILCVPIRWGAQALGAMSIQSYRFQAYDEEDLQTLQALADYCAGALERTRAEAERRQLEEQFRQSQKLEAIGKLAGGIAHDFNNLLTVINGYTSLLLADPNLNPSVRRALVEIDATGQRASELTRQLLAFSRRQRLELQPLSINESVRNIDRILRRVLGSGIELVSLLDSEAGLVQADPNQIDQVLLNLAINARDAMPNGGTLIIETQKVLLDRPSIQQEALELSPGAYVRLSLTDTGCGMSPEVCARAFEPFFTTKPPGEGTGLGLATVHGIVKQSGGDLHLYSDPGWGTTVRLYLPQSDLPLAAPEAPPSAPELRPQSQTILLVDDEPHVRDFISEVLRLQGYTVLEASYGDEALQLAAEHSGPLDLLLTDIVMPRMSGRELARRLTKARPDLPVLFMSGYAEELQNPESARNTAFIAKPMSPAALLRKVQEVSR